MAMINHGYKFGVPKRESAAPDAEKAMDAEYGPRVVETPLPYIPPWPSFRPMEFWPLLGRGWENQDNPR